MATLTAVTLVCDGCGTEADDVETRRIGDLEGEACPECWDAVTTVVGSWHRGGIRRRRRGA